MEKKINFTAYAENVPDDVNNLQDYVADSIDHIVADALVADMRYHGFSCAKSGPAEVVAAAGRLYVSGKVYALDEASTFDFTGQLPVAAKKIVLITAWGSEVDTGATPRNVLIPSQSTPQNPVYQPQVLEIEHARVANLGPVYGQEALQPSDPVVNGALLTIARIVLSTTGVDSVTMLTDNEIPNLADVDGRVVDLEDWKAAAAPQIESLASNMARLSNQQSADAQADLATQMLGRIAVLEAKDGIPSGAQSSSADFFLDDATSDVSDPNFLAKVDEGVRFADEAVADSVIALLNPIDPAAHIVNGALFPAYSADAKRLSVGPQTGEAQIAAYTYQERTFVKKTWTRQRTRYGSSFVVSSNSSFWKSGSYDPISHIFTLNGETYLVQDIEQVYFLWFPWYKNIRLEQFWTDVITEPYLDVETVETTVAGAKISESFSFGQDMWLAAVAFQFTQLDANGPVTVALCETTEAGLPDIGKTLESATLDVAALTTSAKTKFSFPRPVYLRAGKRYALTIVTAGNHFIATAAGDAFPGGCFFADVGGVSVPDLTRHLVVNFYACVFSNARTVLDLQPLQLSGGITAIDVLTGAIAPASTSLTFEVQIAGQWIALSAAAAGDLNAGGNLPPLLPFHVVMQGAPDIMPAIDTLKSQLEVSRPRTAFTHIWPADPRTPPAASANISATQRFVNFEAAYHQVEAKLLTGVDYATETAASSYSDVVNPDGSLDRTWVWNLGAAVDSYKIKTTGTTTTALKVFVMTQMKDWAL